MGDVVKRLGGDGKPRFYVRYVDVDGRRKMRKAPAEVKRNGRTVTGKDAAAFYLAAVESRITGGKAGIVESTADEKARRSITVAELVEKFLKEYRPPRIKDIESYRAQARSTLKVRILPQLGKKAAVDVRPGDVERVIEGLRTPAAGEARGYADASVANAIGYLSRVFTWAHKIGLIDCANPVAGVERPRGEMSIDFLDALEVGRLLAFAEERAATTEGAELVRLEAEGTAAMIATALYAGLRKGELYGLRWPDLDIEGRRLTVARSYRTKPKSGKVRHLRLHPELQRILRAWRERCPRTAEALVFPVLASGKWRIGKTTDARGLDDGRDRAGNVTRRGILSLAGCHVPAKPWHALRHTFASHFMMAGGNILTLQKLLGHATLTMTMIYAHLSPDFMDAEICRMTFPKPSRADVSDLDAARRAKALAEAEASGGEG